MPADHGGDEHEATDPGPGADDAGTAGAADPGAARHAVVLAGYRGDVGAARSASGHADPEVRVAALGALDRLGELTADDLTSALGDPAATVRRRAARLCAGRAGMTAPLVALLDDDEPTVADEAAFALGESAPDGSGPGPGRAEAVRALSAMARDHADALCRESAIGRPGLDRRPRRGSTRCWRAAGTGRRSAAAPCWPWPRSRDREVTEALEALTDDRDLQVRQAAEDLLAIEQGEAT